MSSRDSEGASLSTAAGAGSGSRNEHHAVKPPRGVWDEPRNVQLLIWTFFVGCALVFGLDLLVHRHPSF